MIVIGGSRRGDAVMGQQPSCYAGILAGDDVGAPQNIKGPYGYIAKIANRRCNKVQARRQRGVARLPRQGWIARLALVLAGRVGRS